MTNTLIYDEIGLKIPRQEKIENAARTWCRADGNDPDATVTGSPIPIVKTPSGQVQVISEAYGRPLWEFYAVAVCDLVNAGLLKLDND